MDATNIEFIQNLLIAMFLGSLIGVEREKDHHENGSRHEFGGIRTMSLIGMLGYLLYAIFSDQILSFLTFSSAFLLLLIASYVVSSYLNKNSGATTEVAALFVFLMGVLVAMEKLVYAASVTLIVVLLLYFKEKLHSFAQKVQKQELYATIKFIAVVFIVLPLLPDKTFGPLDVFNPHTVWIMVVLISTISFLSYVAIKIIGPKRGIGVAGFLGGLISSTALTLSFSDLSKRSQKIVNPFVFAIILASSAMFFRVIIEVTFINPNLVQNLFYPLLLMGISGLVISLYFWTSRAGKKTKEFSTNDLDLKSPLNLSSAIKFSLLLVAILFLSKYVGLNFGDKGIYLTAFLAGLIDVDSITISMANLNLSKDISISSATSAIVIATMTNTLVKGFIVLFLGSRQVGVKIMFSVATIILVGFITLIISNQFIYGSA